MTNKKSGRNTIVAAAKRDKKIYELLSKPKPPELVPRVLAALEQTWELAPNMRLTQLLLCAKVIPHCEHNASVAAGQWDEETEKRLKAFGRYLKRERKEREDKTKQKVGKNGR